MSLIDSITSQAWMLHKPVLERIVTLIESRAGLSDPIPTGTLEALRRAKAETLSARMKDWAGFTSLGYQSSAIGEHTDPALVAGGGPGYFITKSGDKNVAVLPLEGVLARHSNMVNGESQDVGMAYGHLLYAIRSAVNDAKVDAIVLDIQSPGGSAHGADEAAAAIRTMAAKKPIIAFAHQMAASAAYYVACGCSMIAVAPDGMLGSIGTLCVLRDYSQSEAARGVKTIVVSSGPMKGAGWPGTPITHDVLSEEQDIVNDLAARFFGFVQQSRGMNADQLAMVNDGRMFLAKDAVRLKLADAVLNASQVIEKAASMARSASGRTSAPQSTKGSSMEWNELTDAQIASAPADVVAKIGSAHGYVKSGAPSPKATFEHLEAAFPDDPAHVVASLKAGHTMEQSQAAFAKAQGDKLTAANAKIGEQAAQITALQAQVTQLSNAQPQGGGGKPQHAPGVAPVTVGQGGGGGGNATADFKGAVFAKMKSDKISKAQAMDAIAMDPDQKHLHRAWVAAGAQPID